jgi:hypothetical protein
MAEIQTKHLPNTSMVTCSVLRDVVGAAKTVSVHCRCGSLDSSVDIVTGYGLDGRGSIPGSGKIFLFSAGSGLTLGPTQPPIQWVPRIISLGLKRPGRDGDHSPLLAPRSRTMELYLHSPIRLHGVVLN